MEAVATTAEHVPNPREGLTMVKVAQCQSADFESRQENTALVGMLLTIRHVSMSDGGAKPTLTSGGIRHTAGQSGMNRQRLSNMQGRPYDRIATFADLQDPGACFAVVLKNPRESQHFFHHCLRSQEGVGHVFLLEEPEPSDNTLGSSTSVPIIDGCLRVLPLANPFTDFCEGAAIRSPDMGHTKYFCSTAQTVEMSMAKFCQASCAGAFCDRQNVTDGPSQKCGCFHSDRPTPLVVSVTVKVEVPPSFDPAGFRFVRHVRSWRLLQLFVSPSCWPDISINETDHLMRLRNTVKAITEHVNNNGGWNIAGWLRTGMVHDSSDQGPGAQSENLASTTQLPHISYIYPVNAEEIRQTDAFKSLVMDLSAGNTPLPAPTAVAQQQQPADASNKPSQQQQQQQHPEM